MRADLCLQPGSLDVCIFCAARRLLYGCIEVLHEALAHLGREGVHKGGGVCTVCV
jgi:hypothetical protein